MDNKPSNTTYELSSNDILLIEDNPADIRLIEEALKDANSKDELHTALDGIEAINYLNSHCKHKKCHCPTLIILDLNLPKKDGFEFLEDINNDEKLDKIPIIVFTTSNLKENELKCKDMGATNYITKPIDFVGYQHFIKQLRKK